MTCFPGCGCDVPEIVSAPVTLEGLPLGFGAPCNPLLPFVAGAAALFLLPPFLAGVVEGAKLELTEHNRRRRRSRARRR